MDYDCMESQDPCEISKCINIDTTDPECDETGDTCIFKHSVCILDPIGTCSSFRKCESGFSCNSYCECEKELISKERREYCHMLIGNFLEPSDSFKDQDISFKMEMFILLKEYEINCRSSEGEFMSVVDFFSLQNKENIHQII
jgi:hypothetical protein